MLLTVSLRPAKVVRVSIAALLRIQDDDSYVLFHTPYTPGSFGPPGGVFKYRATARRDLDKMSFREQRRVGRGAVMQYDLRGFLPAKSVPAFMRWLSRGEGRESDVECLKRELAEELAEVGHGELVPLVAGLSFSRVRTVLERPHRVEGQSYLQIRRFDVYDLLVADASGVQLRQRLLELARLDKEPLIVLATGQDIIGGRCGEAYIGPQSAFLLGTRRLRRDLPPLS